MHIWNARVILPSTLPFQDVCLLFVPPPPPPIVRTRSGNRTTTSNAKKGGGISLCIAFSGGHRGLTVAAGACS